MRFHPQAAAGAELPRTGRLPPTHPHLLQTFPRHPSHPLNPPLLAEAGSKVEWVPAEALGQESANAVQRHVEDDRLLRQMKRVTRTHACGACGHARTHVGHVHWPSDPPPPDCPLFHRAGPSKGGRRVRNPLKSTVADPTQIPPAKEFEKMGLVTAWSAPPPPVSPPGPPLATACHCLRSGATCALLVVPVLSPRPDPPPTLFPHPSGAQTSCGR